MLDVSILNISSIRIRLDELRIRRKYKALEEIHYASNFDNWLRTSKRKTEKVEDLLCGKEESNIYGQWISI